MTKLIDALRERISDYRVTKLRGTEFNEFELTCCTSIELAVIYAELYYKLNRIITPAEIVYFKGGRFISDIIGSEEEFRDIYDMYYDLCSEINTYFNYQ